MRVFLNGERHEDVVGIHVGEFRTHMRNLDRKIEQLAAVITALKPNVNQ
jgi:hypothetical protein